MNAIKQYNKIMYDICRDHNTVGTSASENTDGWSLRDMVSEMQYTLDQYNDPQCIYYIDAHDECQPSHKPWLKEWQNIKARMKRFIEKYKEEALEMECVVNHCSIYD